LHCQAWVECNHLFVSSNPRHLLHPFTGRWYAIERIFIIEAGLFFIEGKMNCIEIEVAVAEYFNPRTNLIVPNVSWGMFLHECDLLVLTPSGYAYEIEIKTSKQDLIKDLDKPHKHDSKKIKKLYFAIPSKLIDCLSYIPERAGVIIVNEETRRCKKIREGKVWNNYKFSDSDRYMLARLGSMRIWGLKKKLSQCLKQDIIL